MSKNSKFIFCLSNGIFAGDPRALFAPEKGSRRVIHCLLLDKYKKE